MRWWWIVFAFVAGCTEARRPTAVGEDRASRPLRACGPLRPAVLYPRHRIASSAPPLWLFVPADEGAVVVELRTSGGLERRLETREHVIRWPPAWPLLREGESGSVTLWSMGQVARSGFVRARWRPPDIRDRGGATGVLRLLRRGLPMEACVLDASDPDPARAAADGLSARAGLPVSGLWRSK